MAGERGDECEERGRELAYEPVQCHIGPGLIVAVADGAGQQWDERDEFLSFAVRQHVVEGPAELAEDRGYARRPVGVVLAGEPRDSLQEAHPVFAGSVGALGEGEGIKVKGGAHATASSA